MVYLLIFFGTVVAFWISAICGGGASLVLIPALGQLLPASQVPTALTIGTFSSAASRITVFWRQINWNVVLWFLPPALPAVWLGAWLLKFVNPIYLEFFIGIFLIANIRQLLIATKKLFQEQKPYPTFVLSLVGACAGFVSGITGAVGLLFNRFYLRYGLSKEQIVATRAANEIMLHIVKLVIYVSLGLATRQAVLIGLVVAGGAIVSSVTVKYILPLLSELLFRRIGYLAMVISGGVLLTQASQKIVTQDKVSVHFRPVANDIETQLSWRESQFAMEFSYDDGFEIEQTQRYDELPTWVKEKVAALGVGGDVIRYEKVFRKDDRYYEIYWRNGPRIVKTEIWPGEILD